MPGPNNQDISFIRICHDVYYYAFCHPLISLFPIFNN